MAGIDPPVPTDGISLLPWLEGRSDATPRSDFLVESWQQILSDNLRFSGMPRDGDCFRIFYGDPVRRFQVAGIAIVLVGVAGVVAS